MIHEADSAVNGLQTQSANEKAADYTYICTEEKLAEWVRGMQDDLDRGVAPRCCLDTEADSLHHYQEKLCLLQLAFNDRFALVDPLAIEDMSGLIRVLDVCEIWFHGADYDLTMLRRTYQWAPKNICDTQIAARLVGYRQFGLAAMIEAVFQKTLSKASQKADWSRRPLPDNMLHYAVDDVRYLLPLADHLMRQVREAGREKWFRQSCRALQDGVGARSLEKREDSWRIQGAGRLQPRGLALLKALWDWRERVAAERDVPCFRVMSNKQILAYAMDYESGQGITPPKGWRPKWKKDFALIISDLAAADPKTWPQRIKKAKGRLSDEERSEVEKLCQFRDQRAGELGLESSLLGSRSTIEAVIASEDGELDLLEWQRELLAKGISEARKVLKKNTSTGVGNSDLET
jgi:ribonuclease D